MEEIKIPVDGEGTPVAVGDEVAFYFCSAQVVRGVIHNLKSQGFGRWQLTREVTISYNNGKYKRRLDSIIKLEKRQHVVCD